MSSEVARTSSLAWNKDIAPVSEVARHHLRHFVIVAAISECAIVATTAYLASSTYNWFFLERLSPFTEYGPAAIFLAAIFAGLMSYWNYPDLLKQARHRYLWNGLGIVVLSFSLLLTALYLLKFADNYSRGTYIFQLVGVSTAVLMARALIHSKLQQLIEQGAIEARRVVLVGDPGHCAEYAKLLNGTGVRIIGSFRFADCLKTHDAEGKSHRANPVDLFRALAPDDVVILAGRDDIEQTPDLSSLLSELPICVHVVVTELGALLATSEAAVLGNLATIQIQHLPLTGLQIALKRIFDLLAAALGLVILSPLLSAVAFAIKLDSRGPVLFRQTRHGYNNETIRIFKFRSMTTIEDESSFLQAQRDDPRLTRIGALLRRTNLDELPQLINVLIGEMSLVGPRPHPVKLNETFQERIQLLSSRHKVRPGITGWAQVNGFRGETDTVEKMRARIEHDLYYIDHWSFLLDIKIIVMTMLSKSAYLNAR